MCLCVCVCFVCNVYICTAGWCVMLHKCVGHSVCDVCMRTAGWCVLLPDLFVRMGQRVLLDDGLGCTTVHAGTPLQVELHNTTDKVN